MELYSWQDAAGEWRYAVLVGTNWNKTLGEVQADPLDMQDVRATIDRMAVGESLFWVRDVLDPASGQLLTLPFPPENVMRDLQTFAREKQVDLYIP
jgi:hypothetical protein